MSSDLLATSVTALRVSAISSQGNGSVSRRFSFGGTHRVGLGRIDEGNAALGDERRSFTTSPMAALSYHQRHVRPDRSRPSAYGSCHLVASDGMVETGAGTGLLRMGRGSLSLSMGGICGSPIFGVRRHDVEGIDGRGDGD
jgi:hypothetical protein